MKTFINKTSLISALVIFLISSCKKQDDWLSKKPDRSTVVPQSVADFQAILDYTEITNHRYSTAGLLGTDNIYLTGTTFNAIDQLSQNLHTWETDIWNGPSSPNWRDGFTVIENANIVIDGLSTLNPKQTNYDNLKGQAFFHRASSLYNLAILFCKAYPLQSPSNELGLPIRLSSDLNIIYQRSNLAQTFDQILKDAITASKLLDQHQPYLQRPNKAAALALLARTYLYMGDYQQAKTSANECLILSPALLDYNNVEIIDPKSDYRFPFLGKGNPEILFLSQCLPNAITGPDLSNPGFVLPELYESYGGNDLRKTIVYSKTTEGAKYRGSYSGSNVNFCGIATNEVYLIRAESKARLNEKDSAMADINTLLMKRFKTGHFVPLTAQTDEEALKIVLAERNKELPFTGDNRWADLKRLNLEKRFEKVITRTLNGINYTLLPNDERYVLPIPEDEIIFSGIIPNKR